MSSNLRDRFRRQVPKGNSKAARAIRDGGDQQGSVWDKKVGGYGTAEFANKTIKRREKNKRAKESRKKYRAR